MIVLRIWVFTPSMQTEFSYQPTFISRIWFFFCIGLLLILGGSVVERLVSSSEISGEPLPAVGALPTVILRTHYGRTWIIRIGAIVLMAALNPLT